MNFWHFIKFVLIIGVLICIYIIILMFSLLKYHLDLYFSANTLKSIIYIFTPSIKKCINHYKISTLRYQLAYSMHKNSLYLIIYYATMLSTFFVYQSIYITLANSGQTDTYLIRNSKRKIFKTFQ